MRYIAVVSNSQCALVMKFPFDLRPGARGGCRFVGFCAMVDEDIFGQVADIKYSLALNFVEDRLLGVVSFFVVIRFCRFGTKNMSIAWTRDCALPPSHDGEKWDGRF